ncbi:MAG: hypothetical protein ACRBBP_01305 [Bdellovibrionales bacterium]
MKKLFSVVTVFILCSCGGSDKENDNTILEGQDGGGGTSIASEFSAFGKKSLELISNKNNLDLDVFSILAQTNVFSVEENICPANEVSCFDAYFFKSDSKIHFNRIKWTELDCFEKLTLAGHEYLRSAGIEDADYAYSNMFLDSNKSISNNLLIFCMNQNQTLSDNKCSVERRNISRQQVSYRDRRGHVRRYYVDYTYYIVNGDNEDVGGPFYHLSEADRRGVAYGSEKIHLPSVEERFAHFKAVGFCSK